jgi:hypothetical protein
MILEILYLQVLRDYVGATGFTIVENGDVEKGLVYEPTRGDAAARVAAFRKNNLPIAANSAWREFNRVRDAKRVEILNDIIDYYDDYYDLLAREIIPACVDAQLSLASQRLGSAATTAKDWPRARNAGDVLGFEQTGEHPCDKLSRH